MRVRSLLALAALVAAPAAFAAPVTYTLDTGHTQVMFSWNHFGFSNPTANFNTVEGTLVYDAAHPADSHVEVTMPVSSLDTHVPALDDHLKRADFFDAAKYPKITFKSTKVVDEGHDRLKVTGNLSVHGVTRPVTLEVKLNKAGVHPMLKKQAIGFDATTTLERKDFGVGAYVPAVSNQIKVRITVEADAT